MSSPTQFSPHFTGNLSIKALTLNKRSASKFGIGQKFSEQLKGITSIRMFSSYLKATIISCMDVQKM